MVDRRLYLPKDWAEDEQRRDKCHVPKEVVFQEKWRMALEMVRRHGRQLPHGWITGDDEFGQVIELRRQLRQDHERYVLDVPGRTQIRDLETSPSPWRNGKRRGRKMPFVPAEDWAAQQPEQLWQDWTVRDGEQGPLQVQAIERRVQTRDEKHRLGAEERLVVIRYQDRHVDYCLSNAAAPVPLSQLLKVHARRHQVEESLEQAKQEVGLGQYECRSWIGWHHHMTLSLLALWFLVLERWRLGEKNPGSDGIADATDLHELVASSAADVAGDRRTDRRGALAQRGGEDLQMVQGDRRLPAATAWQ
jgi:SRSO17 transposase